MKAKINTRRLFFALWPTDQIRSIITDKFSQLQINPQGRVLRQHNLHMTLHFLGQVTDQQRCCMHDAALSVAEYSFQLQLDHFDQFPKAKVFWMGMKYVPTKLVRLHQALGSTLERCGFKSDVRPFFPHVTLMRKCHISQTEFNTDQFAPAISWRVDDFVLVESISDGREVNYQVIEKYPLS